MIPPQSRCRSPRRRLCRSRFALADRFSVGASSPTRSSCRSSSTRSGAIGTSPSAHAGTLETTLPSSSIRSVWTKPLRPQARHPERVPSDLDPVAGLDHDDHPIELAFGLLEDPIDSGAQLRMSVPVQEQKAAATYLEVPEPSELHPDLVHHLPHRGRVVDHRHLLRSGHRGPPSVPFRCLSTAGSDLGHRTRTASRARSAPRGRPRSA